ncbi:hypothetical protein I8751_16065 [Nostocaceae cyanobacterium CENA357]|uniref:Uncharacterized protein n=1 Tax=Atlanticothrix silvestris CENA357 TaxID=1725252 RepID=A0A8J7HFK9_9CYAN|nr:hypothetical protein [Atlanticothrix silvestris]MBH8553858.1 hypothetical protein [Atlanticothrix silvestris CENA357]
MIDVQDLEGKAIAKFDIFQEKLMHLIIVSVDSTSTQERHPVRDSISAGEGVKG